MSVRSLNKVMLIGNLTRDPNLRYTPNGTPVCSFGLATNRSWTSDSGDKQERVDFHNIVSWSKLAEICGQLLHKGDKVFVEGRIQTRDWKTDDGQERRITEIIIENMILLGNPKGGYSRGDSSMSRVRDDDSTDTSDDSDDDYKKDKKDKKDKKEKKVKKEDKEAKEKDISDEIPF